MADIYEQLRARLDEMATGYPATEGGVEIRILRQLFTEEDAALFLAMELKPRTVPEVAARVQAEPEAMAVFTPGTPAPYTLFLRPRDPHRETWYGRRAGLEGGARGVVRGD